MTALSCFLSAKISRANGSKVARGISCRNASRSTPGAKVSLGTVIPIKPKREKKRRQCALFSMPGQKARFLALEVSAALMGQQFSVNPNIAHEHVQSFFERI